MRDFTVDDFLVCLPVYLLLQNPRDNGKGGTDIDGIAFLDSESERAVAVFTDRDLAERYLSDAGKPAGVKIVECDESEFLRAILGMVAKLGFCWVTFDPEPKIDKHFRAFKMATVLKVLEATNEGKKDPDA